MVASGAPLSGILTSIVFLMEAQAEGMLCSILLLHADGKHVLHGAAPSLPEAYVKAVNGAPIGPRNGSCGTAMFLKKPVVVTDVMTDPLWTDYRQLADNLWTALLLVDSDSYFPWPGAWFIRNVSAGNAWAECGRAASSPNRDPHYWDRD